MIRLIVEAILRFAPGAARPDIAEILDVHDSRAREPRRPAAAARFTLTEVAGAVRFVLGSWFDELPIPGRGSWARVIGSFAQDVRYALRTLSRNRGFTFVAISVLALGVGANTAIFSAVNAYFFRPLPFGDQGRLVMIFETNPEFGWVDAVAAPANLLDWREQVDAFQDVSGYSEFTDQLTTVRNGEPVIIDGTSVVGNFFDVLGVPAALGRTFRFDETWEGNGAVVVISHALWVEHFGAREDVIGQSIDFGARTPEIIGVMPPDFRFPNDDTRLWYPFGWAESARGEVWFRRAHWVRAFARLAPGVDVVEADAQLQVVAHRLQQSYPETNSVMGAGIAPMRDFLVRGVRTQLLVLTGAVGLLLVLASANVATLMLVRTNDRMREIAVRRALGAARTRVAGQVLIESALLATGGAAAGLALGWIGVRALTAANPVGIDGATSLSLDYRVVLFAAATAGLSALLFGGIPAMRSTRGDVEPMLREGSRGNSGGRGTQRTVGALVTAEVALTLVLVVGAGLMVRTFVLLREVDPGFRTEGVAAVQFTVPSSRYRERDEVLDFFDRYVEALEARPGVERAGVVGRLPLAGTSWSSQFQAEGWPPERVGTEILHRRADERYFEAVGTPLLHGRLFEPTDGADSPLVVVVNETFARQYFPGEDPIGQRIAYDRAANESSIWYEIVGIVGDQHQVAPGSPPRAEVFENRDQDWGRSNWVVVRGELDPSVIVATMRTVLSEMDPLIAVEGMETLRDVWTRSMARETFVLRLLSLFGAVALLLASVGVYGVTSQAARRRTQEIGVRMALGAGRREVLHLILGQGARVIGMGLVLGLVLASAGTRALSSLLYGVEPTDPATLVATVLLLGFIALMACYVPARRATSVDPLTSLRS